MVKKKVRGGWKVKGVNNTWKKRLFKTKTAAMRDERAVALAKKRVRHKRKGKRKGRRCR